MRPRPRRSEPDGQVFRRADARRTLRRSPSFYRDERGQDLIEYALIAALVTLAVLSAVSSLGSNITPLYDRISARVAQALS